ncbi:MAG: hypothetical protein M3382_04190, partial [Thermoproteota archaeon]|nr:hypothetical protein [Thermoproteota archaeon]
KVSLPQEFEFKDGETDMQASGAQPSAQTEESTKNDQTAAAAAAASAASASAAGGEEQRGGKQDGKT